MRLFRRFFFLGKFLWFKGALLLFLLLYRVVFAQELCEDFLRKLAPELGTEVPRRQFLRLIELWLVSSDRRDAKYVIVHNAKLFFQE